MSEAFDPNAPLFKEASWKRPVLQPNDIGDQDPTAIYTAVGKALSNWERVEVALFNLLVTLSDGSEWQSVDALSRTFGSIESSAGRRTALRATAEVYFGEYWNEKAVSDPFRIVMETVGRASRRRDDIAHGIVQSVVVDNNEHGCFLMPAEYNTGRNRLRVDGNTELDKLAWLRGIYRFKSEDILTYSAKFRALREIVILYTEGARKIGGTPAEILRKQGLDPDKVESDLANARAQKEFDDMPLPEEPVIKT